MKSTALHHHADGETQCWYDFGVPGWFTYAHDDDVADPSQPTIYPGAWVPCPAPDEPDLPETGDRFTPLVGGDEPFTPEPLPDE